MDSLVLPVYVWCYSMLVELLTGRVLRLHTVLLLFLSDICFAGSCLPHDLVFYSRQQVIIPALYIMPWTADLLLHFFVSTPNYTNVELETNVLGAVLAYGTLNYERRNHEEFYLSDKTWISDAQPYTYKMWFFFSHEIHIISLRPR